MNCKHSFSALSAAMILNMIILFVSSHTAAASDTLFPGQSISGRETLVSENGMFELGFFSPRGTKHYLGIRYKNMTSNNQVSFWLGDRIPITNFLNATLYIDAGELCIAELGYVLWVSNSLGNRSDTAVAVLLNTGNFVVRDQFNSSVVTWQSFDDPADALLPGARLGWDMVIGANIFLRLYTSSYNCTLMIDQSRKGGFILFIDGHDYLGTFPDWMVTYVNNGSLVRLNDPENPNDIEFMKLHLGQGLPDNPQDVMATSSEECQAVWITVMVLILSLMYKRSSCLSRQTKTEGFLSVYSYGQLKKATRNFSDKLGEGSFGSVFKGTIVAGSTVVAVKRLKGLGHKEKQFRTEVQTVGMIQHTNLVRLLGVCTEGARRLLVYEYMSNGSLDSHLFSESSTALSWNLRHQISVGVARGLAYLHEECRDCIIHCDIKPENILLDAELCPKIADFGMAKLLGRDFSAALTTIRGTIGYLAPEWISGQAITHKADVYSFGVVLFELISGRRSTDQMRLRNHRYFPLYAAVKVNEGDVLCLLDDRLQGNACVKELDAACRVACWCIQDDEIHRPSMRQVIHMLEGVVDVELPPIPASFQNLMDGDDSGIYSLEV
ncbi:hypothetical protein GUJ93_ZPchr0001g31874 [Zizania palustris]|uniref:non-specific serine/threonine protein kinase n=1 Tax=Zizania palustris TaxID=103762 RepID=A0A8J5VM89_ZIZPA|nr:hypothetical protein GUJ93_ZPchr0001g31874 [Zizania palustris]